MIPDLDLIRQDLPAIQAVRYFNTGGIGPMPRPAWEAATAELNRPLAAGIDPMTWASDLATRLPALRARVARFVGASPDELAFVRSVSEGYNIVLWGMPWQPGDAVLTSSEEHESGLMPLVNLRRRNGGFPAVRSFAIGADVAETLERYAAALDRTVRLVAISQVTTDTGTVLPLVDMVRLAHDRGALVLVDGAQAAGQVAVDLGALGADFYAGIGSKWLMGPIGTGFLYVRRDRLADLEATWTGFTAELDFSFASGALEFQPDARRFEFGARHWPLYFGLGAALDWLAAIGVDAVMAASRRGADRLRAALAASRGVRLLGSADRAMQSSIVTFAVDGLEPAVVSGRLRERSGVVQRAAPRAGGVRLCVGFFNTDEEIDGVAQAVRSLTR